MKIFICYTCINNIYQDNYRRIKKLRFGSFNNIWRHQAIHILDNNNVSFNKFGEAIGSSAIAENFNFSNSF